MRSILQALRYRENERREPYHDESDRSRRLRGHQRGELSDIPRIGRVAADAPSTTVFVSRFIVLQAIAAAAVIGLWIAGLASKPFESSSAPMCCIILLIGAVGMLCVALRRWRDVQWIATHVVRIGLLGTVVGLIIAFSHAVAPASNPEDIKPLISAVVNGMYVSLYATLFGIGTNLWLKINLRLLGNQHG